RLVQISPSSLLTTLPKSPTAITRVGEEAIDDNITLTPLSRGIHTRASAAVKIVPFPPLTINVGPNTPTPCSSFVVPDVAWFQTSPSKLTSFVTSSPNEFVL